jgi:hypothetical protein
VRGRRRATAPVVRRALVLRERGRSLIDIAVVVGVSQATVSRWCRGLTRREVTGCLGSTSRLATAEACAPSKPPELDEGPNAHSACRVEVEGPR